MSALAPDATPLDTSCLARALRERFPRLRIAIVFGSVARGQARATSDFDCAVRFDTPMTPAQKIALIEVLALHSGRPVDVVDLATVGEPLLGRILQHGQRILGTSTEWGTLVSRHVIEQADFMPYKQRILDARRAAWIGR